MDVTVDNYIELTTRTNSNANLPLDTIVGKTDHPKFGPQFITVADLMLQDVGWGIAGEAGEVADLVKKHYSMNIPFDDDKLIKETGDVLWYIAELCFVKKWTFQQLMQANIEKLAARYPEGFSTERAINRDED